MVKCNTPIEVTKKQYEKVRNELNGICAHKKVDDKYWVKILYCRLEYRIKLNNIING